MRRECVQDKQEANEFSIKQLTVQLVRFASELASENSKSVFSSVHLQERREIDE
jgi:hypothetical protein